MKSRIDTGLWIDEPDSREQLAERAGGDAMLERVGHDLIEVGFTILPGLQDQSLIAAARADYDRYLREHEQDAAEHRDEAGRQHRLTNFHVYSPAAMRLAKNETVMRVLDFVFGREAAVYTSLTFQYSTMQALHRDAPYFHTFPAGQFIGVWTALEDIHPDAGPLSYVAGSHRFAINQRALYSDALSRTGDPKRAHHEALAEYQRLIIEEAEKTGPRTYAVLAAGDVAMWHPQLVHGGSPSRSPELTRHSMVVHCCPADTYIFADDVFVSDDGTEPPPRYAYTESLKRKHADWGVAGFMDSI
jgi:ectoine hydroxylase-related dioxygenase (phytanoyl-CoA dioxygenase family)